MLNIAYEVSKIKMRVQLAIAWHLPKWVVYWCTIRSGAYATTGKHSDQIVPDLTLMDTLDRWSKS